MKFLFFLLFPALFAGLQAQEIAGTVINPNQKPLANVAVFNTGSGQHTHTDSFGKFTLSNTTPGDTLNFSHLGYTSFYFVVSSEHFREQLRIMLRPEEISLEQVVITSEVNVLNEVARIDLKTNPVRSGQEVLRVPGLIIG